MIRWPAIIKYYGDPELLYIASEMEWQSDSTLHALGYELGDMLIDSQGQQFLLAGSVNGVIIEEAIGVITVDEMLSLIKKHWQSQNVCCVAKTTFTTVAEMINGIAIK